MAILVTVTCKWYMTLSATHQIWDSYLKYYIRYTLDTIIIKTRSGQGHSDPKIVRETPSCPDASTHQIWNSYLKEYKRYAPDSMQIQETRSEFKALVTQVWYVTLRHP